MNDRKLSKWDVKNFTLEFLLKYLPLQTLTLFTPVRMLLQMIILAALKRSSLEQVAFQTPNSRCGKTLREHLRAQIYSQPLLESSFNQSFRALLPNTFWKKQKSLPLVVDWVEQGYYGKSSDDEKIRRGKPKQGASRFFVYATVYTLLKGQRFTLAMTFVTPQDTTLSVLKRLHGVLIQQKLKAKYYLLDRQFYSVSVMRWLKSKQLRFIIPAVIRGKEGSATRRLKAEKSSRWEKYVVKSSKEGTVEVEMAIVCFNKKGKNRRETFVYATNGMRNHPLKWIKETYRKRFGIEVSHRQRNEFQVKTTSRNEEVRYFYMALGFLMRNIWVWFHWNQIGEKQKGRVGRRLYLNELTIDFLKTWLRSAIEKEYPIREEILLSELSLPKRLRSG